MAGRQLDLAPVLVRSRDGRVLHWTRGCESLFGHTSDEVLGRCGHELLGIRGALPLADFYAGLDCHGVWSGRLQCRRRDGRPLWVEAHWRLAGDQVVEQFTDITDRVAAEEREATLNREAHHRLKNSMTMVLALARMTFGARDSRFRDFEGRLMALNQANALLQGSACRLDLHEILDEAAALLGMEGRVLSTGVPLPLMADDATFLGLVIHELLTNTLKHGALTADDGSIVVGWTVGMEPGGRRLRLTWRERGGPLVAAPTRRGFGAQLFERACGFGHEAVVRQVWDPAGLQCHVEALLRHAPAAGPDIDIATLDELDRAPREARSDGKAGWGSGQSRASLCAS